MPRPHSRLSESTMEAIGNLSRDAQRTLGEITRSSDADNAEALAQSFVRQVNGVPIADAFMALVITLSVTLHQAMRTLGTPKYVLNEVAAFAIANALDEDEPLDEVGKTN